MTSHQERIVPVAVATNAVELCAGDAIAHRARTIFAPATVRAYAQPREQTAPDAVGQIAVKLHQRIDPVSSLSAQAALKRGVQHFYAPGILNGTPGALPLDWMLGSTYANGDRLFLQGAALGVGASTLAADYARSFNHTAQSARDPRRAAYLSLTSACKTPGRFLDSLALALRAPLSQTELRFRSPEHIAARLRVACQRQGISTITIDHLGNAGPDVRSLVVGLMREFDPNYSVALDADDPLAFGARIGMVLIDHRPPEVVFRNEPDALVMLGGQVGVLEPYSTPEQVADAMRQAGIGLEDLDLTYAEDEDMVTSILDQTSGLPALMSPMFALIDRLARSNRCRPAPEVVEAVSPYMRRLIELRTTPTPDGGSRKRVVAARSHAGETSEADHADVERVAKRTKRAKSASPKSVLRKKHDQRHLATLEQRDMLRKQHTTLGG